MSQVIPEGEVPPEIKLVNEFLNTLHLERFGEHAAMPEAERDQLRTTDGLRRWLADRKLLSPDANVSEADRQLAVDLRAALRAAASANDGRASAGEDADAARARFDGLPLVVRLDAALRPELTSAVEGDARAALSSLLVDVAIAAAKGTWSRLKICDAEECQWAYYDRSKSRTGRWCSMRTCGNRHKTRRYRRRRSSERPHAGPRNED